MVKATELVRMEKLFRTEYNDAVAQIANTTAWDDLADLGTEISSSGAEEDYRWLGDTPEFQEWLGDRNLDDLAEYEFTLKNKDFSAAVKIFKNEIEDDKMNLILPRIRSMAAGEKRKWGKLIHDLIVNGTSYTAFDGVAFFANAGGARLNDNLLAGTISAASPTLAQVAADVRTVRTAMMKFVNSRSEIVRIMPDTFVVPPELEMLFLQLVQSGADPQLTNAGTTNPFRGWIKKIVVDPALTDANDFYALATGYSVGPFVRQRRQAVELVFDTTQLNVNKTAFFGADFRGNVGYGLPMLAAKVVSSVG